jgi:hypothetical protein
VAEERKSIYEPTVSFLKEKYHKNNWEVRGLWFRACETASPLLRDFFKKKYMS